MDKDYYKIIPDMNGEITKWVCQNLHTDTKWLKDFCSLGVMYKGKIIAGLIFHDIHFGQDVSWTIYSNDKHWCTRHIIKIFMQMAYCDLQCRRINILVNPENQACLKFVTRLGFKIEGLLRQFREDGSDCYILSLLKSENKYL